MSEEKKILTDEMLKVRRTLETVLLSVPCVDFVSVGFAQAESSCMLVTLGTCRPDLVQLHLDSVLRAVAETIAERVLAGQWVPEIQILKGSTKQTLSAPC